MPDLPYVLTVGVSAIMTARLRRAERRNEGYRLIDAVSDSEAITLMRLIEPSVVVVSTELGGGGILSLCDYVAYRYPATRVIFEMGKEPGFWDGSFFTHSCNAHAMVTPGMDDEDVKAVVAHHAVQLRQSMTA
jgi:hypothetical protein